MSVLLSPGLNKGLGKLETHIQVTPEYFTEMLLFTYPLYRPQIHNSVLNYYYFFQTNDFQKEICEDIVKPKGSCYSSSINKQNCLLFIFIQKKETFQLVPQDIFSMQNTKRKITAMCPTENCSCNLHTNLYFDIFNLNLSVYPLEIICTHIKKCNVWKTRQNT